MQKNKSKKESWPDILHKINSKWVVDLNVNHKTIKFLEENKGENLRDLRYNNDDSSDTTWKIQPVTKIMDKLRFVKLKTDVW